MNDDAHSIVTTAVGGDIDSLCGKCGDSRHAVMSLRDGVVDRVVCKMCGDTHRYKPSEDELRKLCTQLRKANKAPKSRSTAKKTTSRKRTTKVSQEVVAIDESQPIVPYSIRANFEVGQQLDHKKFGKGIVVAIVEPNKLQAQFVTHGTKVLLFGKE